MIIPLKKKNGGLSDARNFGVKYAKGEYLLFIDGDDYIDKDMCEKLYDKAKEKKCEIVCSPITFVDRKNRTVTKRYFKNINVFGHSVSEKPEILNIVSSYATTKLIKHKFWLNNNFKFPNRQLFEDSALIYNVLLKANKIECVNIPFYHYIKDREKSICNIINSKIFDIFISCNNIIDYYKINSDYIKFEPIIKLEKLLFSIKTD